MFEISGKVNTAICYASVVEAEAIEQIRRMCDYPMSEGSKIRIMPDVHYGKGCTIGTTMTIRDKAVPNVVGIDIGCGMYTVNLGHQDIDLEKFDMVAHTIPHGNIVWKKQRATFDLSRMACYGELEDVERLERSVGTLGSGNHFIEIDTSADGEKYLVIHSGSRNLGKQVAGIYQQHAIELNQGGTEIPADLCFVYGECFEHYLHDVGICQEFAMLNREKMAEILLEECGLTGIEDFHTIHNYIDTKEMVLRKGAIAAHKGEMVLIPINMRDGSILAFGKGNSEWNYSAPHGAGRIMSRAMAKSTLSLEEYRKTMEGIYTTCVTAATIDEAPMAYKSIEDIMDDIRDAVDVIEIIKPIYNFKSSK